MDTCKFWSAFCVFYSYNPGFFEVLSVWHEVIIKFILIFFYPRGRGVQKLNIFWLEFVILDIIDKRCDLVAGEESSHIF